MTSTKAESELKPYDERVASLVLVDDDVRKRLESFPGQLSFSPSPAGSVRHRMLILGNQLLASGDELRRSIVLLWSSGHYLAAAHCIRLLFEIWGVLLYAEAKVLRKADDGDPATADQRLQKLLLGTGSFPLLPAGIAERIPVINVMEFIRAGEKAVPDFEQQYTLLCDVSHPTFMHLNFILLKQDGAWANDLFAEEARRILGRIVGAAEDAAEGVRTEVVRIYDACVPPLGEEIRENS